MFSFLSEKIRRAILSLDYKSLYEIRIRADKRVVVNYCMQNAYLTENGVSISSAKAIAVTADQLAEMVYNLCENSVYSYTEQIKQGFISLKNGVRVGLCGECVTENGKITNVKDITSINIRIPHSVKDCSNDVFNYYKNGVASTLVISPPGVGKTTMIRDIAEKISERLFLNVLICDERNEIFPLINASDTVDAIRFSPKEYAFENGIRAMCPDIIITDEIMSISDVNAVIKAVDSGVKVVASVHGIDDKILYKRKDFLPLVDVFDVIVVLSDRMGKGTVERIAVKGKDYAC